MTPRPDLLGRAWWPRALRQQVLALSALAALLLVLTLAIPSRWLQEQQTRFWSDRSVADTAQIWQRAMQGLKPLMVRQAQDVQGLLDAPAALTTAALTAQLKDHGPGRWPLARIDWLNAEGGLLASSEAEARTPLLNLSMLKALQARQGGVFGLIRAPGSGHGAGEASRLLLVLGQAMAQQRWLLVAIDARELAPLFEAAPDATLAFGLSTLPHAGQAAQGLLRSGAAPLGDGALDWPDREGLQTRSHGAALWEISSADLPDVAGYPVARWHVLRPVDAQTTLIARLFALGAAATVLVLLGLGLGLDAVLKGFLRPVEQATHTLQALAQGDLYSTALAPARGLEGAQLAQAVEVFRHQAVTLAQRDFEAALAQTRQRGLIEQQLRRLDASFAPGGAPPAAPPPADSATVGAASLASEFEQMTSRVIARQLALQTVLEERTRDLALVRQALAEREQLQRLQHDMEVARELQMSHLPRPQALACVSSLIDIDALMQPAKEVGGDLYDFHLLDADHLLLVVGDASGKGVPAAMFAMMARSLLRATASQGLSPGACLALVNDTLAQNNDALLFCTLFMGVLALRSGHLRYASAGHNPPWRLSRDRQSERLDAVCGLVLGALPGQAYEEAVCQLHPQDDLVLYSDGITEAHSPDQGLFEEGRLLAAAQQRTDSARALSQHILQQVQAFMAGTEPFDDITLLTLRYHGPG